MNNDNRLKTYSRRTFVFLRFSNSFLPHEDDLDFRNDCISNPLLLHIAILRKILNVYLILTWKLGLFISMLCYSTYVNKFVYIEAQIFAFISKASPLSLTIWRKKKMTATTFLFVRKNIPIWYCNFDFVVHFWLKTASKYHCLYKITANAFQGIIDTHCRYFLSLFLYLHIHIWDML